MAGNRERVDTTPGREGGSRYVRRDDKGQFTTSQTSVGRSVAKDKQVDAKHSAPKGRKDRGD